MPPERREHEWAAAMIVVYLLFRSVGIKKPEKYSFRVNLETTLRTFRQHILASKSIAGILSLRGRDIVDDKTFNDYGIVNGSQLSLRSYNPRKKNTQPIRIQVVDQQSYIITIMVAVRTTLSDLRHMVQDECGMPVEEQIWSKRGRSIDMNKRIYAVEYYNIQKHPLEVRWSRNVPEIGKKCNKTQQNTLILINKGQTRGKKERLPMLCSYHTFFQKQYLTTPCHFLIDGPIFPEREAREETQCAAADSALSHSDSPELLSGYDAVMSHKGAATISRRMVPHWISYANKLGIEKARQKEIRHNNPSLGEQRFQLLRIWIQQEGKAATWRKFISVCNELRDNSLQDSAISLCKYKTVDLINILALLRVAV